MFIQAVVVAVVVVPRDLHPSYFNSKNKLIYIISRVVKKQSVVIKRFITNKK
jgi:hypothetical protein